MSLLIYKVQEIYKKLRIQSALTTHTIMHPAYSCMRSKKAFKFHIEHVFLESSIGGGVMNIELCDI